MLQNPISQARETARQVKEQFMFGKLPKDVIDIIQSSYYDGSTPEKTLSQEQIDDINKNPYKYIRQIIEINMKIWNDSFSRFNLNDALEDNPSYFEYLDKTSKCRKSYLDPAFA